MFLRRPLFRPQLLRTNVSRRVVRSQRRYASTSPSEQHSILPLAVCIGLLTLGIGLGSFPPYFLGLLIKERPPPFTPEDKELMEFLTRQVDRLDIVQKLRAASLGLSDPEEQKQSEGEETQEATPGRDKKGDKKAKAAEAFADLTKTGWREVVVDSLTDTEAELEDGTKSRDPMNWSFVRKSLAGTRGLGVQRIFWNSATKELIAVIWFGTNVNGWPKVVHGGAIATVLSDGLSRAAVGPDRPLDSIPAPSSLAITYVAPTWEQDFYVLRAQYSEPEVPESSAVPEKYNPPPSSWSTWISPWKDLTKQPQEPVNVPNVEVSGTLQTLQGKVCVKSTASWPKSAIPDA